MYVLIGNKHAGSINIGLQIYIDMIIDHVILFHEYLSHKVVVTMEIRWTYAGPRWYYGIILEYRTIIARFSADFWPLFCRGLNLGLPYFRPRQNKGQKSCNNRAIIVRYSCEKLP